MPKRDAQRERAIIERYLEHEGNVDEILDEFEISRQTLYSMLKRNHVPTKSAAQRLEPPVEAVEQLQTVIRLVRAYLDEQVGEDFLSSEVQRYARRWLPEDDGTN
jgi:predicted DNA-binding protein YlxM (UPF0122 family)